jgi:hypothetical protein
MTREAVAALRGLSAADIISDAMHEIGQRVQDVDGEPMTEGWRREFAEAVVRRLADDYLEIVERVSKLERALEEIAEITSEDKIHSVAREALKGNYEEASTNAISAGHWGALREHV